MPHIKYSQLGKPGHNKHIAGVFCCPVVDTERFAHTKQLLANVQ